MIKSIVFKIFELIRRYGVYSSFLVITYKLVQRLKDRRLYKSIKYSPEVLKKQEDAEFDKQILFSIITPAYNTDEEFLKDMLNSCISQTYKNWELCIADGSTTDMPEQVIREYMKNDDRIKYIKLEKNYGISGNTNKALELATGDYVVLLDHDDILHPSALFENMVTIDNFSPEFIYSDMVSFIGNTKNLFHYNRKPKFSIYTLRSLNYICHLAVYSMKLAKAVGPFQSKYDSAQDYDMILKLVESARSIRHIPKILYFWRAHSSSMSFNTQSKPSSSLAAINAISDHYKRLKIDATVVESSLPTTFKTIFHHKNSTPKVAFILLVKTVMPINYFISHIIEKSNYSNFEVIVATNIRHLNVKQSDNIKVALLDTNSATALLNNAVAMADAEQLLFIDPEIEMLDASLIETLLNYSQLDDVGCVTVKILDNNNEIFAAGVGINKTKTFVHYSAGVQKRFLRFIRTLTYTHNITAVPQVLFMIKRSLLCEHGYFNELYHSCCFAEDLSLKLIKNGYNNVFTPYSTVQHHGKITVTRHDISVFRSMWEGMLDSGDPYGSEE